MWFSKDRKFTLLDWVIHFGITVNAVVIAYIVFYVVTH